MKKPIRFIQTMHGQFKVITQKDKDWYEREPEGRLVFDKMRREIVRLEPIHPHRVSWEM